MPKYVHDCDNCKYLGEYVVPVYYKDLVDGAEGGIVDLYYCEQGCNLKTIIARFGNDGPDYISGFALYVSNKIIAEGKRRAEELGYC